MRPAAAIFALLALLAQNGNAALAQTSVQEVTLTLPHPLGAGETAWIEVQVGAIGRQQIVVTSASGQPLGVISAFGAHVGQDAGAFPLPVPPEAIQDNRISIRLAITQAGASRAPTEQEVRSVKLKVR
jgi:hypothetical protein